MYEPREDSYLLEEEIIAFCKDKIIGKSLDMGTGTGIQANTLNKFSKEVYAVDINKEAKVNEKVKFIQSDLFKNVKEKDFDLIVFNPPYLPDGDDSDPELTGGKEGVELTLNFLKQAKKHLKEEGTILFIASSHANIDLLEKKAGKDYYLERVRELPLFFERLYVYKATLVEKVVDKVKE